MSALRNITQPAEGCWTESETVQIKKFCKLARGLKQKRIKQGCGMEITG